MPLILILMSTYNGEMYLSEQLDSILSQKEIDVHILIRDDGSSDNTISILRKYKNQFPDKIDIITGCNLGWRESFFTLAKIASQNYNQFTYFAFSDQDDIWLPTKLIRGIDSLLHLPAGPNLYCSNVTKYKDGYSLGNLRNANIFPSYKGCLIRNYATGCTMVFNRCLLDIVCHELPKIKIAHDYWFYMVACLCGSVIIDDESFILYRLHDDNQVGFKSGFLEIWKRRLKSVSSLLNNHDKESTAKELIRIHGKSMNYDALDAVSKLACYKNSLRNRLALLSDNCYTYNNRSNDFWLKLRILCGHL